MTMASITVVVTASQSELATLKTDFHEATLTSGRALDGDTVIQAVVAISTTSLITFRSWLLARVEKQKATKVSWQGRTLVAYSANDAIQICKALEESQGSNDEQDAAEI
jgi:hypothetical protein